MRTLKGLIVGLSFIVIASPAFADCLSQCDSQYQTCMSGCTSANAKQCVDSCWRGTSACRSRCKSELPQNFMKSLVAYDNSRAMQICVVPRCTSTDD